MSSPHGYWWNNSLHPVLEDGLQLFQLQGRGDEEHALVAVETAVRHEDVGVRAGHLHCTCAISAFARAIFASASLL